MPQASVCRLVIAAHCRVAYYPDKPIDQHKEELTGGALAGSAQPGEKV